jgi:hypothetical protein
MNSEQLQYLQAIAALANKLQGSKVHKKINLSEMIGSEMLWDLVATEVPEVNLFANEVEQLLDCELTYEQCCNAIGWLYNYHPSEWQKYLNKNPETESTL